MLRRNRIITVISVAACALPTSAAIAQQDQPSVVAADHPSVQGGTKDYNGNAATGDSAGPVQGYRSADGADAAQGRGIYETERTPLTLNRPSGGNADTADNGRELPPVEVPAPTVVREAKPSGFDWADAGIGAAGMSALLSIAAGSALFVANRRRRRGLQVATH
jgi:hypothetical protein